MAGLFSKPKAPKVEAPPPPPEMPDEEDLQVRKVRQQAAAQRTGRQSTRRSEGRMMNETLG